MLLVIDESGDDTGSQHRYVVAAACLSSAAEAPALAAELRQRVFADPARTREFHWRREGHVMRSAVLALLAGRGAIAVVDRISLQADQEAARAECLTELFRTVADRGGVVEQVMIESREAQPVNRGQNHRDHATIVEARHGRLLQPAVTYGWYPKTEPLGWLADAVAGAVMESLRGDDRTLELARAAADWFEVRFVGESGSKNA